MAKGRAQHRDYNKCSYWHRPFHFRVEVKVIGQRRIGNSHSGVYEVGEFCVYKNSIWDMHSRNALGNIAQNLVWNRAAVICVLPGVDVAMFGTSDYKHLVSD